jgi:hypothetical protein
MKRYSAMNFRNDLINTSNGIALQAGSLSNGSSAGSSKEEMNRLQILCYIRKNIFAGKGGVAGPSVKGIGNHGSVSSNDQVDDETK